MTDLDRLLEIERDIQANLSRGSTDAVEFHRKERQQLISQLESKLAESDEITNNELGTIQYRAKQNEIVELKKTIEQIQSQYTNLQRQYDALVKALQDKLNKSQKIINERRNNKDTLIHIPFSETEIKELQNLLGVSQRNESTKEET